VVSCDSFGPTIPEELFPLLLLLLPIALIIPEVEVVVELELLLLLLLLLLLFCMMELKVAVEQGGGLEEEAVVAVTIFSMLLFISVPGGDWKMEFPLITVFVF
jgi:hypothetical protein